MYLNSTTGLWENWQKGWYYDETFRIWRDCQGIWTGAWSYQAICYQWDSGKIYDTDLLKWVDTCVSPKVFHNDSQYSINPVWRSPIIYVNPQSFSMIELGTIKYPFKTAKSVFSEILNQYSHNNSSFQFILKKAPNWK